MDLEKIKNKIIQAPYARKIYMLLPEEIEMSEYLAHKRNDAKKNWQSSLNAPRPFDSLTANRLGIIGEIVAARAIGTEYDTNERLFGDSGVDLYCKGIPIAVKYSKTNYLYFSEVTPFYEKTKFAILVEPYNEKRYIYSCCGFISRKKFFRIAERKQWRNFPEVLAVHKYKLKPIRLLKQACEIIKNEQKDKN